VLRIPPGTKPNPPQSRSPRRSLSDTALGAEEGPRQSLSRYSQPSPPGSQGAARFGAASLQATPHHCQRGGVLGFVSACIAPRVKSCGRPSGRARSQNSCRDHVHRGSAGAHNEGVRVSTDAIPLVRLPTCSETKTTSAPEPTPSTAPNSTCQERARLHYHRWKRGRDVREGETCAKMSTVTRRRAETRSHSGGRGGGARSGSNLFRSRAGLPLPIPSGHGRQGARKL
jgi:hypothetical protein